MFSRRDLLRTSAAAAAALVFPAEAKFGEAKDPIVATPVDRIAEPKILVSQENRINTDQIKALGQDQVLVQKIALDKDMRAVIKENGEPALVTNLNELRKYGLEQKHIFQATTVAITGINNGVMPIPNGYTKVRSAELSFIPNSVDLATLSQSKVFEPEGMITALLSNDGKSLIVIGYKEESIAAAREAYALVVDVLAEKRSMAFGINHGPGSNPMQIIQQLDKRLNSLNQKFGSALREELKK